MSLDITTMSGFARFNAAKLAAASAKTSADAVDYLLWRLLRVPAAKVA